MNTLNDGYVTKADLKTKQAIYKKLGLIENYNFIGADEDLLQVEDESEKLTIIKGLIISHLSLEQMFELSFTLDDYKDILLNINEHN